MKARFAGLLFSTCAALLAGCNKYPEVEVAKGDPCESLEPLLAALPTDKRMYGVPMTWRGCSVKHLSALAIYAAPGGHPSYEFTISVIDEKSKYLQAFGAADRPAETGEALLESAAELHQAWDQRWTECKEDFKKPTNNQRPMIFNVNGMGVCIYASELRGKRVLQTFALHEGLGYQLTVNTEDAAAVKDIVQALKEITPAFEKFKPEVL